MANFITQINADVNDVYSWHQNFGASDRLCPPWSKSELLRQEFNQDENVKFVKTSLGILTQKIRNNDANKSIVSENILSENQSWHHVKDFSSQDNKTIVKETIALNIFSSILPQMLIEQLVAKKLQKEFTFRYKRIEHDLQQHKAFAKQPRQSIAILGNSELTLQLKPFLTSGKHTVFNFVNRRPYPRAREIQLNINNGNVSLEKLNNIETVVFAPLDDTKSLRKLNINKTLDAKIKELRLLIQAFDSNKSYPKTFIMQSSTCVYSHNKSNEKSKRKIAAENKISLFYLTLEQELNRLKEKGVRVVLARTGNILSARSGILKDTINLQKFASIKYKTNNKLALNWISIDDAVYATHFMIMNQQINGAVDTCSSMTMTYEDLCLMVTSKLNKRAIISLPELLFKKVYGSVRQKQILQNVETYPKKLKQAGFKFIFENINDTLTWETGTFYTPKEQY